MAKSGINLDKLKAEIDNRKTNKNSVATKLGETVVGDASTKGSFLNELILSLNTGQQTNSTNVVKLIENKVATKLGESPKLNVTQPTKKSDLSDLNHMNNVGMSQERDDLLYEQFKQKTIQSKQTLTDSLESYTQQPNIQTHQQMNMGNNNQFLNENYVNNIKSIINNQLAENSQIILNEAFKDMILEMYTYDRIKEVINENKKMIKDLIYEVLREIKEKSNKTKA
jgi:hypothetical protein